MVSIKITGTNRNLPDFGLRKEFNSVRDYLEWDRAGFDEVYRDSLGEDAFDTDGRSLADWQLDRIAERVERVFNDDINVDGDMEGSEDPDDPTSFMYFYIKVCEYVEYEATLVGFRFKLQEA